MKFRRIAAALLTLALGFCLCLPAAFAAELKVTQEATLKDNGLEVSIRSTGETPLPKETLTVELKAVDNAPMPEDSVNGSKTLQIMDGTSDAFGTIKYTKPGVYCYTITQAPGENSRGQYDNTVYYVKVTASWEDGNFGTTVAIHTDAEMTGAKKNAVEFVNNYTAVPTPIDPDEPYNPPVTPPTPTTPENPAPADARPDETPTPTPNPPEPSTPENVVADARPDEGPKLIQTGQLNWPVPVLTAGGLVLVSVGGWLLHRSKKRDENA